MFRVLTVVLKTERLGVQVTIVPPKGHHLEEMVGRVRGLILFIVLFDLSYITLEGVL